MTKTMYAAVIQSDGGDGLWARFPDLPGCFGYGESAVECAESASNALETHLAAMEADGLPLPEPSEPKKGAGTVAWFYADTSTVDLGEPSMTAAEAARALGVTPGRVSQLVADGRLEARRVGGATLVSERSVSMYASTPRSPGRPRKEPLTA